MPKINPKDVIIPDVNFVTTWCENCKGVQLHTEQEVGVYKPGDTFSAERVACTCEVCHTVKVS